MILIDARERNVLSSRKLFITNVNIMKKIALLSLALFAAGVISSCCCQDQGAPPLNKMPKFNDLEQPAGDVVPMVMKSKK